uniref:ANK_REP_REGION domain-containing protein n=1 Tax=Panagrellus redivivus TaxID=6233 RepID=A0A7E4VPP3_PANRE
MSDNGFPSVDEQMEVDVRDDDIDEAADCVGELGNDELWEKIRDNKKKVPDMFVSAWEEDEDGITEKDLTDPKEQFLTAAEEGNLEVIREMVEKYPDFLHVRDRDEYTPLHRAAYNNHVEVCKFLLSAGANPEAKTEDGWTVLHCAACWANHAIVGVLLSHGVDVNARSNGQLTPLHLAINSSVDQTKQLQTVKNLLEAPGIDMGAVTNAGDTPLMLAHRVSKEIYELVSFYCTRP